MTSRILVVDDEEPVRDTLRRVLESGGFMVETASDAQDGLQKARKAPFSVVLLDYMMPGKNGLEALPEFVEAAPGAAVVMLTAYGTVDAAKEAIRKGAADFLVKPIKPPDLFEVLKRVAADRPGTSPASVLVAEDDPETARLIQTLLEREGYSVKLAASGEEALRHAQSKAFDILVTEARLPDLNGLMVVERALTYHKRKPAVVVLAADPNIPDAVRATKLGAVEYLAKPVEPNRCHALLARLLEARRWEDLPERLQAGKAYLVLSESPERACGLFLHITGRGLRGLAFCRNPELIPRPSLGVQVVALGGMGPSHLKAADPVEVFTRAETFYRQGRGVLLLEGAEYLSGQAGFQKLMTLLQGLRDLVTSTGSLLLCPVNPKALSGQELALLKKELHPVDLQTTADRVDRWRKTAQNLPAAQRTLYDLLVQAGGSMGQAELAEKSRYSRARLSRVLDQMEGNGLLVRRREGMGNLVVLS